MLVASQPNGAGGARILHRTSFSSRGRFESCAGVQTQAGILACVQSRPRWHAAPHDLDVQDAVDTLVRHYHAEEEQRQPPAVELADRAWRVATQVNPAVQMMPPMTGVVGLPLEDAR